jgi:hypothetical protein
MDKAEEKQVKAVVHRCPFCHEGAEADGSVVCQGCLARHHEACWNEAGRCGSCGTERALAPTALPPLTVDQAGRVLRERGYAAREVEGFLMTLQGATARPAERRGAAGWVLTFVLLVLVGGVLAGLQTMNQSSRRQQQQLEVEHAKLQRLLSEEYDLRGRLDIAKRVVLSVKAEREGLSEGDESERRRLAVSVEGAEAEVKELQQRLAQTQAARETQEYLLGPR